MRMENMEINYSGNLEFFLINFSVSLTTDALV